VLAVAVALGGIGTGAAAAAPKHLSAPKHLRIAPKHLSVAPKHLGPSAAAPKHLALAPKHLSAPSTADPATDPASFAVQEVSHRAGNQVWWPWAGVLHGAFTTQTRAGARAWTVQRGEVVSVDAASATLVVRSPDGFVGTWTVDPAARVLRVAEHGGRALALGDVPVGARVSVVGSGAEAAGTATLVQVTAGRPRPSGTPSSGTPSDPPSGGGTSV
jgi:hypothetical protein